MGQRDVTEQELELCDREPIHRLGRTQRGGMLIAADAAERIAAISSNAKAWTGRSAERLVGRPLAELLPRRNLDAALAHGRVAARHDMPQLLFDVAWPGRAAPVDVAIHRSGEHLVLEALTPGRTRLLERMADVAHAADGIVHGRDVPAIAACAAQAIQRLTGFGRVMVYRFAADHSGTVIAEQLGGDLPSYRGLHFPPGDIPTQARALYIRSPIRVIEDARHAGFALLGPAGAEIDLSLATLRSVSPVHLQYLRNMGTMASMSVSITIEGQLWGLIACHHARPRRPSLAVQALALLIGRLLSLSIGRIERDALHDGIERMLVEPPVLEALFDPVATASYRAVAHDLLARTLRLTGSAWHIDGRTSIGGDAPAPDEVPMLADRLAARGITRTFTCDSLAAHWPDLARLAPKVAGMMALPLAQGGRDWLLLFREEVQRHVEWAGNPNKPYDAEAGRLTPRASFDAWRELVRLHGEPWSPAEVGLAEVLRTRLIDTLQARREHRDLEEARRAGRQQTLIVRELNHRLRNMLGLINGLVKQTADGTRSVEHMVTTLQHRIGAMARAQSQIEQSQWRAAPLKALVLDETRPFCEPGQVETDGPPLDLLPDTYLSLALVVHELATNARKYGALSQPQGRLAVRWSVQTDGTLLVDWQERGGPPVRPPTRRGFGSRVIVEALAHELRGSSEVAYDASGLHARLRLTRGFVAAAGTPVIEAAPGARGPARLPASTLLVEDDLVIALLVESMLVQRGCRDIAAVARVADAMALLDARRFDLALLDVDLGDETSERVALRLQAMRIPIIVASGYANADHLPLALRGHPLICKPYADAELDRVLAEALGQAA